MSWHSRFCYQSIWKLNAGVKLGQRMNFWVTFAWSGVTVMSYSYLLQWLSVDQAGFLRDRSTCEQVSALTTFNENGFEKTLKTDAVFLNLTAAYHTIWHNGLLYKRSKCLPLWCIQTVELLLRNRRFQVQMGDDASFWRRQTNGLLKGSVLVPTLFNLYTNDLPVTCSRSFTYANDICCAL